jgi:hypothetical protein
MWCRSVLHVWVLLVSLCNADMVQCDSERLTTFRTQQMCEDYAGLLKDEMLRRGKAGAAMCFDEPMKVPLKDSTGKPYAEDGVNE